MSGRLSKYTDDYGMQISDYIYILYTNLVLFYKFDT